MSRQKSIFNTANIMEVKSILAMPKACQFYVIIQCLLVIEEGMFPKVDRTIIVKWFGFCSVFYIGFCGVFLQALKFYTL